MLCTPGRENVFLTPILYEEFLMNPNGSDIFDTVYLPESRIAQVSHVSSATVEIFLPNMAERREHNIPDDAGQVGQFIIIENGDLALFSQIADVHILPSQNGTAERPVGKVELLTTLNLKEKRIIQGVVRRPQAGASAYKASEELVRFVAESRSLFKEEDSKVRLELAALKTSPDVPLSFPPERMFGRHCAILGSSGGGKSWTTARLIEQCAKFNSKVVLLDATGEYYTLQEGVRHLHIGYDPNPRGDSIPAAIPYYQLNENDLFAIFRPTGQSQAPKLRAAMKSLKLARLAPDIAPNGTIIKANKEKRQYRSELQKHYAAVEDNSALFDVRYLTRQIHNECVNPNRSPTEPMFWGGPNAIDQSNCVALINRINDIIKSPNLAPIFNPGDTHSLIDELERFTNDDSVRVLRISLQYLSFAHNAREIIANAIGRQLLMWAREERFRKSPTLILVDEAHQFLNVETNDENQVFALDSFALIAKEGRKYALNICLATQRPRDIPEAVLSQVGTFVVHRLVNESDRKVVEQASGEMDEKTSQSLPILAPGEAILMGVDYPIPMALQVIKPTCPPDSSGPDFQKFWS